MKGPGSFWWLVFGICSVQNVHRTHYMNPCTA